jgi:polysaccharide pyruvyl transferase WcaK-like protein
VISSFPGAFQISIGLGAGNIGDELMARAFWQRIPPDLCLEVPLFPESRHQREPYPPPHRYLAVEWYGNENAAATVPGLLVGATPVTEAEGLHWPLQFLAPRLQHFHRHGLPVDAFGVGVDRLYGAESLALFREHYSPIRSWTVRSFDCRDALLSMGIPEERIRVGSDWAWLYQPRRDLSAWAATLWRDLGIDVDRPLLLANVVNMIWRDAVEARRNIASAFDHAARRWGLQIAFFCNESRGGEFFDFEAGREIAGLMSTPAKLVPNEYYSPDETLAIVGYASVAVGQRYHFIIQAALAGVPAVAIVRGQKMKTLAAELDIPVGGSVHHVDRETLDAAIEEAVDNREAVLSRMTEAKRRLTSRAGLNLSLLEPGYFRPPRSEN